MEPLIRSPFSDVIIPDVPLGEFMFRRLEAIPGDAIAIVDSVTGETWTYSQLATSIKRLGIHFAEAGVVKGSVVAIYAPNHPLFPITFHAIAALGAISTTCNPLYTTGELLSQLKDSGASFVVTTTEGLDKVSEARALLHKERPNQIVKIFTLDPGATLDGGAVDSVRKLLEQTPKLNALPKVEIDVYNDIATIPYSSGTTGLPKGVMLTHRNLVANILQIYHFETYGTNDCTIAVLPFFHIYGLQVILNVLLYGGAKVVVMSRFDLVQFLTLVQNHKATAVHIVPPIMLGLAKHPVVDKFDLSSVKVFVCAAAPLGSELQKEAERRLKTPVIKQGYGMTEASPATHINPNEKAVCGSVGVLLPNCVAKIVDENGNTLPIGSTGEVCFKGPNVMKGYLNNPQATAITVDADGFLHTGDIGRADAEGYFYIVDRLKELIKYKGFQVPPAELEALLITHPSVADAAVIPVPDEEAGELPKAYVVLKPNQAVSESELAKWIGERVAPHKKLRGGVRFTEAIPKSPSGKILRRMLTAQERAAKGQLS